jgi:hypothetical protein
MGKPESRRQKAEGGGIKEQALHGSRFMIAPASRLLYSIATNE